MDQDEKVLNRIRAALADVSDVTEKRMFGGTAFMVGGKICVTGRAEQIMCRIDPSVYESCLNRDGCRPVIMKGRKYRGYVYVDTEFVKTKKALKYWIDLALRYNETLTSA